MLMVKIGIIGGSGLDDPNILQNAQEIDVNTPLGKPSSTLTTGKISGVDIIILARHGKKHTIMPSNVNFRANIWALKDQGCTHILAITAVGSLKEEIRPGHLVFPDQVIDRTTKRASTFYDRDKVCHIPMGDPFCRKLRKLLADEAKMLGFAYHDKATLITIEGPRFSTRAESHMFRTWGADIINMSVMPECTLAREAGICYQPIAMSTDYDCWHVSKEAVTWEQISKIMSHNAANVKELLLKAIPNILHDSCACKDAIKTALV